MSAADIAARLRDVRDAVDDAAARAGRDVTLVAVSKRHPPEAIRAAYEAGQRDFGENYAQELRDKRAALADLDDLRWHYIGALQSNKVKYVVGTALVQTVDRASIVSALDARALREGVQQAVLVEVNLGEDQKAGALPSAVPELLDAFAPCEALRCVGLMVIPPAGDPEATRPHFRALAELSHTLRGTPRPRVELNQLSMGMSSDYAVAIEEGATIVRVGTAIFGPRPA